MYVVTYFDMDHSNSTSINDTIIGFPTKYDDRTVKNNSLHIFKHNSVTGYDEYTTSSEQWALGKAYITEGVEGISNISCEYVIPKKFIINQTGIPAKINIDVNQFYSIVDDGGALPIYLTYRNIDRFLKLTLDSTTKNLNFFSQFNTESDDTNNSPNIWMIIGIIGASIIVIPTIYCIILIAVHKKSMKKRQLERQRQRLTEQNEQPPIPEEDSTTNGGWK